MHGRKPDPIDGVVGARIRLRRKFVGLSQQALGEALGITFQQVQKYERGSNRVSASMLVKIARKLNCPVSYLLAEEELGGGDDSVAGRLAADGALELLEVYARLPDEVSRRAVMGLARTLAEGGERAAAPAASDRMAEPPAGRA